MVKPVNPILGGGEAGDANQQDHKARPSAKDRFTSLLLERTGVSGNAQPFAIRIDPGVGESPVMIEGLTFV